MPKKTGLSAALASAAGQGQRSPSGTDPKSVQRSSGGAAGEAADIGARKGAATYREGRVNITGYFAPAVKQSLRLVQAKHPELTVQDILAEALDDLFAKYNVPQSARLKVST